MKAFASDNYSGVHPKIMEALLEANQGHAVAYGADPYTERAQNAFRDLLGKSVEVFFTFNGTGANVLALKSLLRPYQAVICCETAHINVDECGAPELLASCKLLPVEGTFGKLTIEQCRRFEAYQGFEHNIQPKMISISQSTELGTVYTPQEVRALADYAHSQGMYLHMDGARISNAAAALHSSVKAISFDCGVDVLSFGGTKNGLMFGEALIFARPELAKDAVYHRKQSTQLASKMRFIAAQFLAYLDQDLYLELAHKSNAMAALLSQGLQDLPEIPIVYPNQVNAVFAQMDPELTIKLQERYPFYVWDELHNHVRWMCSWDTQAQEIQEFLNSIKALLLNR